MSSVDDELRGLIKQVASIVGAVDHGLLAGLGDDDHGQYLLIDGSRAMTGNLEMDHIGISRAPTATHMIITGETFTGEDITIVGIGNFPTYTPGIAGVNVGYAIQGNIWFGTLNWNAGSSITGLMFLPAPTAENVGSAVLDLRGIVTGGMVNVAHRQVTARYISGVTITPISHIFDGGQNDQTTADIIRGLHIPACAATDGVWGILTGLEIEKSSEGVINRGLWLSGDGIGADLLFGEGPDANVYYDNTNLVINPKFLGAGLLQILGDLDLDNNELKNVDVINDKNYYVATDAEFDAAITDIEANNYRGTIHIIADLTNVQATFNDAAAEYIIDGHGHHLDPDGNNQIFVITNALKLTIQNCYFDCSDYTAVMQAIDVTEANNNPVLIIHNIFYNDDVANAQFLEINSDFCIIMNNHFIGGAVGVISFGAGTIILGNIFTDVGYCLNMRVGCDYSIVAENTFYNTQTSYAICFQVCDHVYMCDNTIYEGAGNMSIYILQAAWSNINGNILIDVSGRGIYLNASSDCVINNNQINNCDSNINNASMGGIILINGDRDTIVGNIIRNCNNAWAGQDASGIYIDGASDRNITALNIVLNNDVQIDDSGTNQITDHNIVA